MSHPCQFSPEVLDVIEELQLIRPGDHVHDPYAGPGNRLGVLCDRLGVTFSGTDIEEWPGHDPRVVVADAADPTSYPTGHFKVLTSPTYANKRCADYRNGPTPTTKTKGRRDYGIALGRALHPRNFARLTGRPARAAEYYEEHSAVVKLWPSLVIVNVDLPISDPWCGLLQAHGYVIDGVLPAFTRRYGGLDNADKRAAHEVVIAARRAAT